MKREDYCWETSEDGKLGYLDHFPFEVDDSEDVGTTLKNVGYEQYLAWTRPSDRYKKGDRVSWLTIWRNPGWERHAGDPCGIYAVAEVWITQAEYILFGDFKSLLCFLREHACLNEFMQKAEF
jgi:hypothetical protein